MALKRFIVDLCIVKVLAHRPYTGEKLVSLLPIRQAEKQAAANSG